MKFSLDLINDTSGLPATVDGSTLNLTPVTVTTSDIIDLGYELGSDRAQETSTSIPADKHVFIMNGVPSDEEYSIEVRAYRSVDKDVEPTGLIKSAPGYLPSSTFVPSKTVVLGDNVVVGGTRLGTVVNASKDSSGRVVPISELLGRQDNLDRAFGSTVAAQISADAAAASQLVASAAATNSAKAFTDATAARDAAQVARDLAIASSTVANAAKTSSEAALASANAANASAQSAKTDSQTARDLAQNAQTAAVAARDAAQSAQTDAANKAAAALASQGAAATSAAQASGSKTDAETSATAAQASLTVAQTKAKDAADSASAAATSASGAASSSNIATQKASAANTSATNASTSAGQANTSATNSAASESNALSSKNAAAASAALAATSATNSGNSATAANTSAGVATTQATNSGNSATAANTSAVTAQSVLTTMLPERPSNRANFYTNPTATIANPDLVVPISGGTIVSVANEGDVFEHTGQTHVATRGWLPVGSGRTFQFDHRVALVTDANPSTIQTYIFAYNAAGVYLGIAAGGTDDASWTVAKGWRTFTRQITSAATLAQFPTATWLRASARVQGTWQVAFVRLRDITDVANANTAANAAAISASAASTKADDAGVSATAAQSSATQAETARGQASTFAANAANSADTAAGSASTAATQAGVATQSKNDAASSATAAGVSATTAGTAATNASSSATAANTSAVNAASSFNSLTSAQNSAITAALPSDFSAGFQNWTNSRAGGPLAPILTAGTSYGGSIVTNDPDFGSAYEASNWITAGQNILTRGVVPATPGRVYEIRTRFKLTSAPSDGVVQHNIVAVAMGADYGGTASGSLGSLGSVTFTAANQVYEIVRLSSDTTIYGATAWPSDTKFMRYGLRLNSSEAAGLGIRIGSISVTDVTARLAAEASATAAATSASTAITKAGEAGQSASAASASATNANTSAGNALTYSNNASTSASNAAGSANTASTQAGVAAQAKIDADAAKNQAQGFASAASGSASSASSEANFALQRAQAADASKAAAETAKGLAEASRASAAVSESNAAGSANSAATSATVSAFARDAASDAATAASTSAATASASKDAAGQSASAANASATNASTSAGNASTSASNASTSASNANGSANTASTQAGLSTSAKTAAETAKTAAETAKTAAQGSATAANTSAGTAASKADAAGTSASAAQTAALSAIAQSSAATAVSSGNMVRQPTFDSLINTEWTGSGLPAIESSSTPGGYSSFLRLRQRDTFQSAKIMGNWAGKTLRITAEGWAASSSYNLNVGVRMLNGAGSPTYHVGQLQAAGGGWITKTFDLTLPVDLSYVALQPFIQVQNDVGGGTLNCAVSYIRIEDVTNTVAAQSFSTLAAGSANTASVKANEAAGSASTANAAVSSAQSFRDSASTNATNALSSANSASASAASAASSAVISSSYSSSSINVNDKFANWTNESGYPVGWSEWASNGTYAKGRVTSGAGSAYAVRTLNNTANVNSGFYQNVQVYPGKWILTSTAMLEANSWQGAGVALGGTDYSIHFATEADTNQVTTAAGEGATRTWSKLITITSNGVLALYAMHGYVAFGPVASKNMRWYQVALRPANAAEIAGSKALVDSAANAANITTLSNTVASATQSISNLTTTVSAQALAGGNMLSNTDFPNAATTGWGTYNYGVGVQSFAVNTAGDAWHPVGENVLGISQPARVTNEDNGGRWSSDRVTVTEGASYSIYAQVASIRAPVEVLVEWYRADGSYINANSSGRVNAGVGGNSSAGFLPIGMKSVKAPVGAATASLNFWKWNTDATRADSYAWFWRPYFGLARDGQTEFNPYSRGNGSAILNAVSAQVQTTSSAVADIDGKVKAYLVSDVSAGDGRAIFSMRADGITGSSNIDLAASQIRLINSQGGVLAPTLSVQNGNVTIAGDLFMGSGRIVSTNGAYMKVQGTGFGTSNQFLEWFGPNMPISACAESNAKYYLKTTGDSYFGGSLTAGTLRNGGSSTSTAADASFTTGVFGSNAGRVTVVASWTYNTTQVAIYPATNAGRDNFRNIAASYGAVSVGGGSWQGGQTRDTGSSSLTLLKNNSAVTSQSTNITNYYVQGYEPVPGGGDEGQLTISASVTISLTYSDPELSANNREFRATLSRSPGLSNNGTTPVSQAVTVNTVE